MIFSRDNLLEQSIDISGSTNQNQSLVPSEEVSGYGARITGQTGSSAALASIASGVVTITGLTGMSTDSVGRFITLSGAASAANNGTFKITSFISATSVKISNSAAVIPDTNNDFISWIERNSYMLEDDLNYTRTDRRLIKGTTNWYDAVPTYTRPTATSTSVAANLSNLASKTTDALGFITERVFYNATVAVGNTKITLSSVGNLKHSDGTDYTGVPVIDAGPYLGNYDACYVKLLDKYTDGLLIVDSGAHAGEVIYGVTKRGSSTSPNSVEVIFYSLPHGTSHSTVGNAYTWEAALTDKLTLQYGYFLRLDQIQNEYLRPSIDAVGSSSGGGGGITPTEHAALRQLVHLADGVGGPMEAFTSGSYRETLPLESPFPTSVIWWDSPSKVKKIVEKLIVYDGQKRVTQVTWKAYDAAGVLSSSLYDTITYSGTSPFESSRVRTIV